MQKQDINILLLLFW